MRIQVCIELESMDLILLFQMARGRNMDVESFIKQAIIEKIQRESASQTQIAVEGEKK